MENQINIVDTVQNISTNFESMTNDKIYMKETFVNLEKKDKFNINFRDCHVAICPNGGMIAICKKKGVYDISKGTKINQYIIVMYQNIKKKYLIPIDWNYKERYVINLEFNEKEQLYAVCNDGTVLKIDILTQKAVQKKSSELFRYQNIVKAKLFEDGFVALTVDKNFYLVKDIKNSVPKLIFPMTLLKFSNNVDFLLIPASNSKSEKMELLITNDIGKGIIHIIINEEDEGKFPAMPKDENPNLLVCKGVTRIKKDVDEDYYLNIEEEVKEEVPEPGKEFESLGKIVSMALSPKKDQFALYDDRGAAFIFYTNFEEGGKRKKAILDYDKSDQEQISVIKFQEGCQFLFCGIDAVALCGQRYIFLMNENKNKIVYKFNEHDKIDPSVPNVFFKCISEIDGLRLITNDGVYFISKVPKELIEVCKPFSKASSKELLKLYEETAKKVSNTEKKINDLGDNLPSSIYNLQLAAANIFWTNNAEYEEKKEAQIFLLRAAQHAKYFVKKDLFNFDKFYTTCKDIRIVNNLRNHSQMPKLITYNEYQNMDPYDLINILIRNLNFGYAFKICQYLEIDIKLVYEKYAIACIKKIAKNADTSEEESVFNALNEKLKKVENFSFINLAKKAFKYNKDVMGMKFLENEKSILTKLPKYIDKCDWDKVLELSENIIDTKILMSILEKILKKTSIKDFVATVVKHPKLKTYVVEFMNKNLKDQLDEYMEQLKTPEELFFYALEQYFQSSDYNKRMKYLTMARTNERLIDNTINPNFEHKFYKSYLDSLEKNLTFKVECLNLEKTVIPKAEVTPFDISIYDTYKLGVKAEKYNWIETQNKTFNFSPEGMIIMRLISYGEIPTIGAIEAAVKKNINNLKKMNLTYLNLADIYFMSKSYDNAAQIIKYINDPLYFEYKIEMLKYMDKLDIALEAIITDKTVENKEELVMDIIKNKPKLKFKAKALAEKNNVVLNLE